VRNPARTDLADPEPAVRPEQEGEGLVEQRWGRAGNLAVDRNPPDRRRGVGTAGHRVATVGRKPQAAIGPTRDVKWWILTLDAWDQRAERRYLARRRDAPDLEPRLLRAAGQGEPDVAVGSRNERGWEALARQPGTEGGDGAAGCDAQDATGVALALVGRRRPDVSVAAGRQ